MKIKVLLLLSLITTSYAQTIISKDDSIRFQLIKLSLEDGLNGYSIRDTSQANIKTVYILDSNVTIQQLPKSPYCKYVLISDSEIREVARKSEIYFTRLTGFTLIKDSAQIVWEYVSASFEDNRVIQRIHGSVSRNYHLTNDGWTGGIVTATTIGYGRRIK
jgi:hypothetical protein